MKDSSYKITIHTDGSCLGNPGPGGWAAVLRTDRHRKEICGGYALTTNNRMEILAVIKALGQLRYPCQVDLYTDSRYVCDSVEKGWIWNWQKKGWIKSNRKPALNADLWQSLIPLLARHKVRFHWLRGHAGHAENERCDELARCQATRPDLPTDNGYVQTEIPRKNPQAPA